jgi:chitinase
MYHKDPTVSGYLKAQKERVGAMFGQLDAAMPSHRRTVNKVQYDAWQPQGLEAQWNSFMNSQYILADTKTTKVGKMWLPKLQQAWASDAKRKSAEAKDGDTADQKKEKETLRKLINDIDELATAMAELTPWTNPF